MTDETREVGFEALLDALLDTTELASDDPPPAPDMPPERDENRGRRERGGQRRHRDR